MKKYDVAIIGAGVSGVFASLRIAEHHRATKTILFEFGRPPLKRRRALEGWLGSFPFGDGKIYPNDLNKVLNVADGRRAKSIAKWFFSQLDEINPTKLVKNKLPNANVLKKFKDSGFSFETHDYKQWKPDSIHQLSKLVAERIEDAGNVTFSFDNEVYSILKRDKTFLVSTADGDYYCKKVILCVGRSSWRWVNKLYRNLGILIDDDVAKFGITIELAAQYLKEFNKCHCTFTRDDLQLGPFSWGGSIIQEDHADLTTAAFRSNEERWKTDKVFCSLIGFRSFKDKGCYQTDRLAKLAFLLSGDRVGREKIKTIIKKDSQLMLIPEYTWLVEKIEELNNIIPSIISRGYYHAPAIIPMSANIRLSSNLESEVEGLFIAGESANISGIAAAGITGAMAAEGIFK